MQQIVDLASLHLSRRNGLLLIIVHGFIAHFVFNKVEPRSLTALCALLVILPGVLSTTLLPNFSHWIFAIIATFSIFYLILSTSVVAYRLSPFHPLYRYPGRTRDRISQLLVAWISRDGKRYVYDHDLHTKYGDVVRIGPNEISISDPVAIQPLYGVQGLPKGFQNDGRSLKVTSIPHLISILDRQEHARRRTHWLRGLNAEALRGYEPTINKRVGQLIDLVASNAGSTVDISQMLSYFSYDFMSDMAFGGGTEMMRDGDVQSLYKLQDEGIIGSSITGRIPWISSFSRLIAVFGSKVLKFRMYCIKVAEKRLQEGSQTKDLFYHLIDEGGVGKERPSLEEVISDGCLAIVAGSDTTALTLSNLLYFLMANPEAYRRLQSEVDQFYPPDADSLSPKFHGDMPYLSACINESLRLYPAVPAGSQRACYNGMGARMIGPYYVPEGTAVSINTYYMQRDSRNFFPGPNTFWPERWLIAEGKDPVARGPLNPDSGVVFPRPKDFRHNDDAFVPFSHGPANCVGKFLALKEMKTIICHLMQRVDLKFADGYDPVRWEEELQSYVIFRKSSLPVSVSSRKS